MVETLNSQLFVEQFIHAYQQKSTALRECCTHSAIVSGDRAHFLIGTALGDMVTRAADGSIPYTRIV